MTAQGDLLSSAVQHSLSTWVASDLSLHAQAVTSALSMANERETVDEEQR